MDNKNKKDPKKGALGRGLSALLEDNTTANPEGATNSAAGPVGHIPVEQIETNPWQPRTHFDIVALEELAQSIKEQGIIKPLTVRRLSENAYQLISGERRLQASKLAGLKEVPAYVRTADDEQMMEMALIENIQREDLNPMEVALAYKRLMDECKLPLEKIGEKVGKNRATVNNYTRLLKLPPEIQIGIRDNLISMGHARAIINMDDPVQQLTLYKDTIANDYSVRKVEELVREIAISKGKKVKEPAKNTGPLSSRQIHIAALERELTNTLGSRVKIAESQPGKGELRISFGNEEEFDALIDLLK
jgi:ParB family chromosome partitioning protein